MKEATGSNNFGPLGIYASTYALYKMTRCEMRLKPLVGDSAVSGTVCRASWNPTTTPSQTSWSSLGARKHIDVTPGKVGKFVLTAKDLKGPKDGWYKTNTQGDPMMAFAGALEIHTIGKTMSTYRNEHFAGGLFLVEVVTEWQFKDYQQQPGMLNLVKGEDTQNAKIETGEGNKLQLVLPDNSRMARAATTTASEIIWVVTDTIIRAGAALIPPPFGWLIRGGWWLVKRAAGAPVRSGEMRFDIYASISDARSNTPCLLQQQISAPVEVGGLHFQQLTPGNAGVGTDIPMARSIDYPDQPQGAPTQIYVTRSTMLKLGTTTPIPSACVWYNKNGGQNHHQGVGFLSGSTKVATFNVHEVEVITNVGPIQLSQFPNQVPITLFATRDWPVGKAVASSFQKVNDTQGSIWLSNVLFQATEDRTHSFGQSSWHVTTVKYPAENYGISVATPSSVQNLNMHMTFRPGRWYVAQFVVQGVINGQYMVGDSVIASNANTSVPTTAYTLPNTIGNSAGLIPAYISGLHLTPFTTDQVVYSTGIHRGTQGGFDDLQPSFGYDDAFEFPPPPPETEDSGDEEDEFEDPEQEDDDEELELGPDDHYSDPPLSRLVVRPEAQLLYENLVAQFPDRVARLAVNQLHPSDEYSNFTELYHDALADGLSPREARAHALGL